MSNGNHFPPPVPSCLNSYSNFSMLFLPLQILRLPFYFVGVGLSLFVFSVPLVASLLWSGAFGGAGGDED